MKGSYGMSDFPGRLEDPVRFPNPGVDEWHDFLVLPDALAKRRDTDTPRQGYHRVLTLRDIIENEVPRTAGTIKLIDHIPESTTSDYTDEILALAGTWRVPDDHHAVSTGVERIANPLNAHAHSFSDVLPFCACGTQIRKARGGGRDTDTPMRYDSHGEGCCTLDRLRARVALLENRADACMRLARMGCLPGDIVRRLGLPPDSAHLVQWLNRCDISSEEYQAARREGRRRMLRTMLVLLRQVPPDTVARIYGYKRRQLSKMIKTETVADMRALYSVRRRAQSANYELPPASPTRPYDGRSEQLTKRGGVP